MTIFLSHPVRGDIPANLARAKRWILWCYRQGVSVVATWLIDCELLDDSDLAEREAGLRRNVELVSRCDELWLVGGRISEGMQREADAARAAGIPVRDLTHFGEEPPQARLLEGAGR